MYSKVSSLADNVKNDIRAKETIEQLKNIQGNPNATVTIYRATIGNTINKNDWIFLSKEQADKWTKTPLGTPKKGVKVITKKVKAKKVDWTGKNLEFVYLG